MNKEDFKNKNLVDDRNKSAEKYRLSFDPDDIRYVIVENEDEILDMIEHLNGVKEKRYHRDTIKILSSRILTKEQIFNDF